MIKMFTTLVLCLLSIYVAAHPNKYLDKRIVGGISVKSSSWPMVVSIRQGNLQNTLKWMNVPYSSINGHFCSGTLINNEWVLTAASCFPDPDVQKLLNEGQFNYMKVRKLIWLMKNLVRRMNLDDYKVCLDEDCARWSGIAKIIIHPRYLISIGKNSPGFDIAMIKLSTPSDAEYSTGLIPKSGYNNINSSFDCKTAGWGITDINNRVNSGEFREFQVELVDGTFCKPFIKRWELCGLGEISENMRSDFCFFDSGGPLMCRNNEINGYWQLFGLISRGTKDICGDVDQRGIYTEVSAYRNWISSVIQRQ